MGHTFLLFSLFNLLAARRKKKHKRRFSYRVVGDLCSVSADSVSSWFGLNKSYVFRSQLKTDKNLNYIYKTVEMRM